MNNTNVKTIADELRLKLPAKTLKELRSFGICPEWFATEICPGIVRDMLADESLLANIMRSWAKHNRRAA